VEFFTEIFSDLTSRDRTIVSALFILNIVLLFLARPIINLIAPNQDNKTKIKIAQALNVLVLVFQLIDFGMRKSFDWYEGGYLINLGISLMVIYSGVFLYSLAGTLSRKRFGKTRMIEDQTVYLETYNSAFTSGIWAPDIVSGLIILNSDILVDGDVVVIDGHKDEFIIARITLIYVVLYDVRNNHRSLLRNTQFIQNRIDNLSRVASSKGIRQALKYNIGYPEFSGDKETRKTQLAEFRESVDDMFTEANEICNAADNIFVNESGPFQWAMTNAGDYALEYTLWVYLDRIPSTKVTATVRKHLMGTLYKVNDAVFTASVIEGIDLSTPDLVNARIEHPLFFQT